MVFKIAITNIDGKRTKLSKIFKTRRDAERYKNKFLEVKIASIKRKGKSSLNGFNPRVVKA